MTWEKPKFSGIKSNTDSINKIINELIVVEVDSLKKKVEALKNVVEKTGHRKTDTERDI